MQLKEAQQYGYKAGGIYRRMVGMTWTGDWGLGTGNSTNTQYPVPST